MSLTTNRQQLVMTAVQGAVAPAHQWAPFEVGSAGEVFSWPSTGGITYNVKIGDSVFGWAGEHIEPGVSTTLDHKNRYGRTYRTGAVTIGVVIHSDSPLAGHGPGMMTLMSACDHKLVPVLRDDANVGVIKQVGRYR